MLVHVQAMIPEEACGLLSGRDGHITKAYPITNELHSPVRFRMKAEEQLKAFLEIEKDGVELLAIYHSHPQGPGFPSITDLVEFEYPDVVSLVWWHGTDGWRVNGFLIAEGQVSAVALVL